ncbi:MAG: signal peptide peptidase [Bacteroidetes bacterium]|jgi:protease-4|nr:signal peptide peptidase [Bacteroidota bacterium]
MKQFLKFTLATIVGVILASLLGMLIFFGVVGAIAGSSEKVTEIKPNSVYQLDLRGSLVDRSEDDSFSAALAEVFGQPAQQVLGLDDILANIEKAKNDPNIAGIYLKGGELMGGFASMKEIRDALIDFKKGGKFIVAYADNYLQKDYFLASVADKVLLNPEGMLELKGLSAEVLFLKNTLDKLGIQMQVVKVGTYKSAVEPYINTKMSDANREQVTAYAKSLWSNMLHQISFSRKVPVDSLNAYADEMMMFQPTAKSVKYHLVDSLVYVDQVDSILKSYAKDYKIVKHADLLNAPDNKKYEKNKLAVIYAVGGIDDGDGEGIVSETLVENIDKAAKDESVKAVVLRVSSPGGSAYGSEQIWRALSNLKAKKPLIVSMGDYAASGGYYISCIADKIVAQPNTITGSIGIFGLIPNIEGLNNKLGFTYDGVKTNKLSDLPSINRAFRPEESELMQAYVNRGYELFVKRCADGRKKSIDEIKAIAEGRVWTGEAALKLGLVDKLGGINEAIKLAAEKGRIKEYQIKEFPEKEDFMTKLMKSFGGDVKTSLVKAQLGEHYELFRQMKRVEKLNGIQARLPYELIIK